jgi:hypothetical protein
MSIGDFSPMMQVQINPPLGLTNVGTLASGTSSNGSNQTTGIINAFWFILGDAMIGFFYTNLNSIGSGNVTFDLDWTNEWDNGFKTPLRYYTYLTGFIEGVNPMTNFLVPHEGQGHLDFMVNNLWGNQIDRQAVSLIVFKGDSQIGKKFILLL